MKDLDREDEILDKMIPIIERIRLKKTLSIILLKLLDYFGGVIIGRKVDE